MLIYIYIYLTVGEKLVSCLSQTLIKIKKGQMKWMVKFVQTWILTLPHPTSPGRTAELSLGIQVNYVSFSDFLLIYVLI